MHSALPKVAHPLAGQPIVRHVIDAARAASVDDVVVVVGPGAQSDGVRAAAGDDVRFAVQPRPLGTGDAVRCARDASAGAGCLLILNGDVPLVLAETLRRLMAALDGDRTDIALLTADVPVESYGVLELDHERVTAIIETKESVEGIDRREVRPINAGQYAVRASWLWPRLEAITPAPNGEVYLTALAAIARDEGRPAFAVRAAEPAEVRGINDRIQLAEAEAAMRDRVRRAHMLGGVTIADPASTFIDATVRIAPDSVLLPDTHLLGATTVGGGCTVGPGSYVRDAVIGDRCLVRYSMIEESTLEAGVEIGPYSHVRPGSRIGAGVHIGNYAEIKASRLGPGTKMGHFSYIGDADVGADVNIGAGTITANYDGERKHATVIGDGAFIGSDSMLVAPVRIGRSARTGAGSVVTRDVPDGMQAVGAPARLRAIAGSGDVPGEQEGAPAD